MDASYLTLGVVLIGAGFACLLGELLLPHGGFLAVVSIASVSLGVAFVFFYDTTAGLITLVGVFVAAPVLVGTFLHYWQRTPMGRRLIVAGTGEEDTVTALPVLQELEQLKGRYGRALSALRPAGVVDFDGRRVDTITEGMMVEPDQWVRCIDVRAGKVIVRPAQRPNLDNLENAFFS